MTYLSNNYLTADDIAADLAPLYCERYVKENITKRRDFPAPIRIGSRRAWKKEDYERWIEERKAK